MEGWIYWIYGWFWSWKSLWAVILIINKLKKWEIVFSNIRLNKSLLPNPQNYYYFDWFDDFYDILAFSWLFAVEVSKYNKKQVELWFPQFKRGARPGINVFFDEMWIFANAKDYKEIHNEYWKDLQQYILQCRKLFVSLYLIIQRPNQLVLDLRWHIPFWITFKPLWNIEWLWKWAWSYWIQELDSETFEVFNETHQWYDSEGNYYNYVVPQEKVLFSVWWKPFYYAKYDDLFLNKVFDTKFRTNYLYDSSLLSNLKLWYIKNKSLLDNKHIYENLIKTADNNIKDYSPPDVPYSINPILKHYIFYNKIKSIITKKYYFKDFLKYIFSKKEESNS